MTLPGKAEIGWRLKVFQRRHATAICLVDREQSTTKRTLDVKVRLAAVAQSKHPNHFAR